MRVFLYSISIASTPRMHNKYEKTVLLFGITSDKKTICFRIDGTDSPTGYSPHLLVRQNPSGDSRVPQHTSIEDLQRHFDELAARGAELLRECPEDYLRAKPFLLFKGLLVSSKTMTPLVGFTANRQDTVLKISYHGLQKRYNLLKHLEEHGLMVPHASVTGVNTKITVIHARVSPINAFLHESDLTLQTWYDFDFSGHSKPLSVVDADIFLDRFDWQRLKKVDTMQQSMIPALKFMALRSHAHSSTATAANMFQADPTLKGDFLTVVHMEVMDLFGQRQELGMFLAETFQEENILLSKVTAFIKRHNPHIIVQMSDTMNDLVYIAKRCQHHVSMDVHLSMIIATKDSPTTRIHEATDGKLIHLEHPGRERVDLVSVLQKLMISPPMDGFRLQDAYDHPTVIKNKALCPLPLNSLLYPSSDIEHIIRRIGLELRVMANIVIDNDFIGSNMALSKSCDASLTEICERGQQLRVFNCFSKFYHAQGIYINHLQLDVPFVTVAMSRADSDFPNPPWIENPGLASLCQREAAIIVAPVVAVPKKPLPFWKVAKETPNVPVTPNVPATPHVQATKKAYTGGKVMSPVEGFYSDPRHAVCTIDFSSHYPSLIRAYRICFMRVVYDKQWLETLPRSDLEYVPVDDRTCCVFVKSFQGAPTRSITDIIMTDIIKNREKVRQMMSIPNIDAFEMRRLTAMSNGCKVLQNGAYGFLGSPTSGMLCTALAGTVCMLGAVLNLRVRQRFLEQGCICIYGDTDSVLIQLPTSELLQDKGDILTSIVTKAQGIVMSVNSGLMVPCNVELESVKWPMLLTSKKKTYAAIEYNPRAEHFWTKKGKVTVKGLAFKKRDRCRKVQSIGQQVLSHLLYQTLEAPEMWQWFQEEVDSFSEYPDAKDIEQYVLSCALNTEYKSDTCIGPWLAHLMEQDFGKRPLPGQRLSFVIGIFADRRLHYQSTIPLHRFVAGKTRLDVEYYLRKQLLLPLKQLLDMHPDVFLRMDRIVTVNMKRRLGNGSLVQSIMNKKRSRMEE